MLEYEVIKLLKSVGIESSEKELESPPRDDFGDLSFPCFNLARKLKRNPNEIALEIGTKIKIPKNSAFEKVEVAGPYVNFFYNYSKLSESLLKNITKTKEKSLVPKISKKTVTIDFSSPNPAHPIHVGSARSTFIGESLSRIFESTGSKVYRLNYVNDLGRQVAVLVFGIRKFSQGKIPKNATPNLMLDIYVKANKMISENKEVEKEVEEIIRKAEGGDKKILSEIKIVVDWWEKEFQKIYKMLGIKFDEFINESKFIESSKTNVKKLLENKYVFKTEDGATVVDFRNELPSTIILRSDGTGLYLTRDVETALYKFRKYKPDLNIYVVAEDQKLHFQQQFKILEFLGHKNFAEFSHHLSYGYVTLPEGKMSSRLGNVVLIEDVLNEAFERVKTNYKLDEKNARKVAMGAVIYAILKIDPNKQVVFKWEDILSLQGDTGPYIQYAYTRANSILKKAKKNKPTFVSEKITEEEKKLIKLFSKLTPVIQHATNEIKPNLVCNYCYELATAFNNFYEKNPVLKAEGKTKNFRLTLVRATEIILKKLLYLIDIETPEKM